MAATPVIYTGKGLMIAEQEYKTLRSEQTTELTFNQMDANFSKVTRVNVALDHIRNGAIIISLFDKPIDPSKFDTSAPFAVLNVSGTITEVGINTGSGYSYLDSDGKPEGKMHSINNSIMLGYDTGSAQETTKNMHASSQSIPVFYGGGTLAIMGLSSQTAVFDLNIGLTWIQPNIINAVFNPSYLGLTSNSMANG